MAQTEGDEATSVVRSGVNIGDVFAERYEIQQLLGRGGMGSVFRVHDREVAEVVALKLLDATIASPEAIERFRREVRLARRVTHRNAARTYDLGEHQSWRFLTMEYVDGESLRTFLGRQRLSCGRAVEFAQQMAEGLAAAHEAGVIHRDLKPANVLVERSGRIVLTDFGIARAMQGTDATLQTGGLLGTPAYMAPEQVSGERVGERADIYALGLILHEMLTGRLPFAGGSPMAVALARLHQPLPDFAADPHIPAPIVSVLNRCLAREASERVPSASALAELLDRVCSEVGPDTGTLGMPARTNSSRDGNLALSIAVTSPMPGSRPSPTPSALGTPSPGGRALAVLPFRFRGPEAERYVAEALSDELIDVLSTMRGLRVSGSGATARFADAGDRDPRLIGGELGVDVVVDGTVQLAGKRVRISARLLAVDSGFQLWSERYDGALEDVFELQDKMGKRIAEALRLELEDIAHRGDAPLEAIEFYLRARQLARSWDWKGPTGALVQYEQCRQLAPAFKPAMAGYAIGCLRAWFLPSWKPDEPDWETLAREAVEIAVTGAPELAETHLAAGIHAVQHGQYKSAAESLRQALRIAPTYAAAHEYLGRLQIEAGRPEQGVDHLELALQLDPGLVRSVPDIARHRALHGDLDGYRDQLARFFAATGRDNDLPVVTLQIRVAGWYGNVDQIVEARARLGDSIPETYSLVSFAQIMTASQPSADDLRQSFGKVFEVSRNPRFNSLVRQLGAEAAMFHGLEDLAMEYIQVAAGGVLVDFDWLEHCPLFAPLRRRPEFEVVRTIVRGRAEAVWAAPSVSTTHTSR
ncbi:serine/threonine-protein kinase [Enhygromyxa salina]|uniref:non-specific serine/threonine protein kinase n=1 Tax=Enhygromyxa salina TaxID=215803 RepID=A0A2S9YKL0_9BACT|nr:serine/threonine-protein kinase [Enhygromyxa salina]PRQ05639.1 Serine/threonine-protein kinase StkP [Enhygromyxa salina]